MEDNWFSLYDWQREYRIKHTLTASSFVGSVLGLTHNPSFIQFLSRRDSRPSTRTGSVGLQLRTALSEAKCKAEAGSLARVSKPLSLGKALEDLFNANQIELRAKGILSMIILSENPLNVEVATDRELTRQQVQVEFPGVIFHNVTTRTFSSSTHPLSHIPIMMKYY